MLRLKFIFLIVLLLTYRFIIKKVGLIIDKKMNVKRFKKLVFLVPVSILISIILIKLIGLSFENAGFILGNVNAGTKSIFYIGLPLAIISAGLVFTIPNDKLETVKYGERKNKWQFIYVWIFVGFVEEILYRGFIQGTLNTIFDGDVFFFTYATILSSVIFVIIHIDNVLNGDETWEIYISMIPTRLIAALVLGYSFQVSKSLIFPIIIHNLIDGLNLSIIYYRKKLLISNNDINV